MLREQAERTAAELAERQRQVERLAADLAASRRRIVAAGDEMRRRIERNLHDGVQQRLVTLSLRLRDVRDGVPDSLPAIRDDLDQVTDTLAVHSPPGSGTVLTARLPPGDPFG